MGGGGGIGKTLGTVGGGIVGAVFGGPVGAAAGSSLGGAVGAAIDGPQTVNTGGVGGVDDLRAGLQEQSNEIVSGLGPTADIRRERQQKFAEQLYNQATGSAPSLAQAQLKSAMDRNLAQQVAAAKANRAVNPALAQRQIMNAAGQQAQQTAQAGALAAMQERLAAQQQFAGYLGQQQQLAANTRSQALGGAVQAQQIGAQNAATQNAFLGNLMNTGATLGAAYMGMPSKTGDSPISDVSKSFSPVSSDPKSAGQYWNTAAHGALVKGKEVVPHDSPKNDNVPTLLSAGEMVIPKTVVQQGPKAIKSFAEALLQQHGQPKKMNQGGMVKPSDFAGALTSKYKKER